MPMDRRGYPDSTVSPATQCHINCVKAPQSVLPGPFLNGLHACRWFHLWRISRSRILAAFSSGKVSGTVKKSIVLDTSAMRIRNPRVAVVHLNKPARHVAITAATSSAVG